MIDYDVLYVDDRGDKQEYVITSTDIRTAMNNLFKLCPDAKRIIRCVQKPMFAE